MLSKKSKSNSSTMPPPPAPVPAPVEVTMSPIEIDAMFGLAGVFAPSAIPLPADPEHSPHDSTGSALVSGGGLNAPMLDESAAESEAPTVINGLSIADFINFLNTPPTPVLNNTQQQTPLSQSSSSFDSCSPTFQDQDDFARFINTPPSSDETLAAFLTSPAVVSPSSPFQTSPALELIDDINFNLYANQPLFFDAGMTISSSSPATLLPYVDTTTSTTNKTVNPSTLGLTALDRENSLDGSSRESSQATSLSPPPPILRPIQTTGSPTAVARSSGSPASVTSSAVPQPLPTGIRKNVKPADLLPVEAPIQSRNYITPSATSRREIPPSVARTFVPNSSRKRSATSAGMTPVEEMHDELADEGDEMDVQKRRERESMDPEKRALLEHVEASRRRNTLAARKSRARKLEHVRGLEEVTERLQSENEALRNRVAVLEGRLKDAGLDLS